MRHVAPIALGLLLLTGCQRREVRAAESPNRRASMDAMTDTIMSREEALRLFQAKLPRVDALRGGTAMRDSLVLAFVRALERADTARLVELAVTESEFAYLYYPTAREGLPPYSLMPDLAWFLHRGRSDHGIQRALKLLGGRRLGYVGYQCADTADVQGENRVWGRCVVRRVERGDTIAEGLFAGILERDGRYKFLSYANRLD